MAYTEISVKRILEIIKEIEARKEHPNAATTYKDVPALQEIDKIVKEQRFANGEPLFVFDGEMR